VLQVVGPGLQVLPRIRKLKLQRLHHRKVLRQWTHVSFVIPKVYHIVSYVSYIGINIQQLHGSLQPTPAEEFCS